MKKEVFIYLRNYTFDPNKINRLIISAYLRGSEIASVKNNHLSKYIIKDIDVDFEILSEFVEIENISTFEQLIELFEFVISPEEKTVNGAVYTPEYIREYIVENSFESSDENIGMITICDPACGCAGFLLTAAKFIKRHTTRSYSDIYSSQLFGLDIEEYSIDRSKLLLSLLAISEGEDEAEFSFNLHVGNALSFKWEQYIKNFTGFDFVLGNPPYVCSRNMDQASLDLMVNWEVSKSGHPDLYIPFFQLGYEILKPDGILGYITVNTFIKSINGRALRDYFSKQKAEFKIINFGGEQVFKNRSTYTCLCFIQKREKGLFDIQNQLLIN
jgi:adenine-specific DNA-methyltransferase